ncbi:MAG: MFS transporter [Hyphomicrobiaceae bacterium]
MSEDPHGHVNEGEATRTFLAVILVLTFVMNTVGRGVTETFAVFLLPVQEGLAVSRSEITLTYSIYMLANGGAAPFAGQLIDRLGARATYGLGILSLGVGYFLASYATHIAHYYICVGLLGGIGAASLGMVTASSLLSRWFVNRIGSVMSLPYAAVGAGMIALPPFAQLLVQWYGWRTSHQLIGAGVLALFPCVMLLPLGRITAGSPEWQARRTAQTGAASRNPWPVSVAMRTGAFWGLFAAYCFTSFSAYAVLPQSVAALVESGFAPLLAASAFGMMGLLSTLGIVAIGWMSDRFGRLITVTISYLVTILGVLALIATVHAPSLVLMYAFVICFGLMQGARGPILVALVSLLYPGGGVGSIFGALSLGLGIGAALGSWASGLLHEIVGGYTASFGLAVLSSTAGMLVFLLVPSLRHERLNPSAGRTRTSSGS